MKRGVALLCAVLILCSGCATYPVTSAVGRPSVAALSACRDGWYFAALPEGLRQDYAVLRAALTDAFSRDTTVSIRGGSNAGQAVLLPVAPENDAAVCTLVTALTRDNPQFFYLGTVYSFASSPTPVLKLTFTLSAPERARARARMEAAADDLLDGVPEGDTYARALCLHDRLLRRVTYHTAARDSLCPFETYPTAFSAYGALVEGRAVCEGYAAAYQYLLRRAGIPAVTVSGCDRAGGGHMWNAVKLDGQVYFVDPTWDDTGDVLSHAYFAVSTRRLAADHVPDADNPAVPDATAEDGDFFRRTNAYFAICDQGQLARRTAARLDAGEIAVEWRFAPAAYRDARFFVRQTRWFAETVSAFSAAPLGNFTVVTNDAAQTVIICKK